MSFFSNLSSLFSQQEAAGKTFQASKKLAPKSQKPPVVVNQKPAVKPTNGQITQPTFISPTPAVSPIQPATIPDQANTREAQAKAREIIVEARSEALSLRSQAEEQARLMTKQIEEQQQSLEKKLDRLDMRLEHLDKREEELDQKQEKLNQIKLELEEIRQKALKKLESVVGLTREEAKAQLMTELEKSLKKEMSQLVRQKQEEAQTEADEKVKEILVDSMFHGATDHVAEYTISVVQLPNEETKGKIIGKSGKNINSFERETGVDVDLDVSPTEVRLSCFDPVRREVARISLERLIKDGRIQPTRIEETVDKVRKEIEKITFEAGKKLCNSLGIYNLPPDLIKLVGKFKYRFSYGQNLITHTLEETKIGIKLASELGLDTNVVKLGCLLHDIGKVSDEAEGSHVELGVKIAKRFNMPQAVIDCIAQHHEDESFSGPEQMVVYIADAISGARPGARYENYDEYVTRLQNLEEIAQAHDEVKQAYAIQAGREVRILLKPEASKDDDVVVLSRQIRDEIKEKLTYPGTVTVTVIRETRAQEIAH